MREGAGVAGDAGGICAACAYARLPLHCSAMQLRGASRGHLTYMTKPAVEIAVCQYLSSMRRCRLRPKYQGLTIRV